MLLKYIPLDLEAISGFRLTSEPVSLNASPD